MLIIVDKKGRDQRTLERRSAAENAIHMLQILTKSARDGSMAGY